MESDNVNAVLICVLSHKLTDNSRAEALKEMNNLLIRLPENTPNWYGFVKPLARPVEIGQSNVQTTETEHGWFGRKKEVQRDHWHVYLKLDREMPRDGEEHRLWKMFAIGHMIARLNYRSWYMF